MFGTGILIAGGGFLAVALLDKLTEDCGFPWVGIALRILVPIAVIAITGHFLQTNIILTRWIK